MADTAIVPASPGYFVIYAQDDELFIDEPIIAWCIVSSFVENTHFPEIHPITPEGKPASDYIGYQYPDGRVTVAGTIYDTLTQAQADRSKQFAASRTKTA